MDKCVGQWAGGWGGSALRRAGREGGVRARGDPKWWKSTRGGAPAGRDTPLSHLTQPLSLQG